MDFEILNRAMTAVAGLTALIAAGNLLRRPREPKILEPNCLLTRHPIEFWTGPRSIFYFTHFWGDLPLNLAAHGHQVRLVRLPWMNTKQRHRWVSTLPKSPKHLILDAATAAEFADFFEEHPPLSITIIDPPLKSALDRLCFESHRRLLKIMGLSTRSPRKIADPAANLRSLIRDLAEEDWISS